MWDPEAPGEYQWFGFRMDTARDIERRWRDDGLIGDASSFLTVEIEDGTCAGWVTWRPVGASSNFEIGIAPFEEHRGAASGRRPSGTERVSVQHYDREPTPSGHRGREPC